MQKDAEFSDCGRYRYRLSRVWNDRIPSVLFIGLNPSTADAEQDDPTVRRCIGFARQWGYGGMVLVNLFAWRATDPRELKRVIDPIGPENDRWIAAEAARAGRIVAIWGNGGRLGDRDRAVLRRLGAVYCMGRTKKGCPRHPLYLAGTTPLERLPNER